MAAKKSARYLTFAVPLWGCPVHVVEGPSLAEAVREVRRRWPDVDLTVKEVSDDDGLCLEGEGGEPVIILPVGASAGVVAHECLHATHYVLKRAGVRISTENDEPTANTLQAVVDAVTPWLTTRRKVALPAPVKPAHRPETAAEVKPHAWPTPPSSTT